MCRLAREIQKNIMVTAEKCHRISRAPSRNESEGLPAAVANMTLEIMENKSNGIKWRKENLCKSCESLTATAVVAIEINPPRFRASTTHASWNDIKNIFFVA